MKPPSVAINPEGAEVHFDGVPQWRIDWSAVLEVAIDISVVAECGYSEAFWQLTGQGVEFCAPVELVAGADEFNAVLFALPGFDHAEYTRAREAEANAQPGHFVCWRR